MVGMYFLCNHFDFVYCAFLNVSFSRYILHFIEFDALFILLCVACAFAQAKINELFDLSFVVDFVDCGLLM